MRTRMINKDFGKAIGILLFYLFTFLPLSAQTYTLEQLKDSALHNNFAIRKARYDINAAQQQRREAFTKYFPNVSATGLWFNANKGMAETTINPSELIPQSLGQVLAQKLPQQVLADLANPINVSRLCNPSSPEARLSMAIVWQRWARMSAACSSNSQRTRSRRPPNSTSGSSYPFRRR